MGISSLKLFLTPNYKDRQEDTLYFLINAITFEQDSRVQEAILDTFKPIAAADIDHRILDKELQLAIERNRALTSALTKLNDSHLQQERFSSQKTASYSMRHSRFAWLTQDELGPLDSMSRVIVALVHAGAYTVDFSSASCVGCDFSHSHLSKVNFSGAYLPGAQFTFPDLRGASFRSAYLGGANFYGSNLERVDLSGNPAIEISDTSFPTIEMPSLECADLRGANLSNRTLAWLSARSLAVSPAVEFFLLQTPAFHRVTVDGTTRLSPFGIVISLHDIAPNYDKQRLIAIPGKPDLVNKTFGFDSNRFLLRPSGQLALFPYTDESSKDALAAFRSGQISETSAGGSLKSESLALLVGSLKQGKWIGADLPSFLSDGIRSIDGQLPRLVPDSPATGTCEAGTAPVEELETSSTYLQALQTLKSMGQRESLKSHRK